MPLSDEQLRNIHREAVDAAMHQASERDGFGSNMSPESIIAGLRAVEAAVRADQIEKDAKIADRIKGNHYAYTMGREAGKSIAVEIRAQLNGDSNAE